MLDVANDLEAEDAFVPFNKSFDIGARNCYMIDWTVGRFLNRLAVTHNVMLFFKPELLLTS